MDDAKSREEKAGLVGHARSGGALLPGEPPTLRGAVIKFRPVPGLTRSSLQRIIDCHLARNASLGYPAQVPCPLALKGVSDVVKDSGNALVVEVTSPDLGVAREIVSRAERLGPRPVQKKVETPLPQT